MDNTNYIRCTSRCPQITLSFSNRATLPSECQEDISDPNIYDYVSVCGIEYSINYDQQSIDITFQASNDTGSLDDQKPSEFLVQTIWLIFNRESNQPNTIVRKYGCNTKNDCARDFYLKTIDNLVNNGASQLELIKDKLYNESALMGAKSRRRCTDERGSKTNKTTIRCGNGLCYARQTIYDLNEQQNSQIQECKSEYQSSLLSQIEHHIPKISDKDSETLEYRCNKNVCNRNDMIPKIQNLIKEITQWDSINTENLPINEKIAKSLAIKETISSFILVLFLIPIQLFV